MRRLIPILFIAVFANGYCPDPYIQVGSQCLDFISFAEQPHAEARQLCHSADGELATVLTATQFKAIVDYINNAGLTGRSFWIDGTDETEEGKWVSSSGFDLPMGTPFWEADNERHQPDNTDGIQHCLQLTPGYFYYMDDVECTRNLNFICETPLLQMNHNTLQEVKQEDQPNSKSIDCPSGYLPIGNKCLQFQTWAAETWETAKSSCAPQGILATIDDPEELREIYLFLHQQGLDSHTFYLGGSDSAQEGNWIWLDGSPVPRGTPFWGVYKGKDYVQEPQGGTNENCLILESYGHHYFRDINCGSLLNPLCQYTG